MPTVAKPTVLDFITTWVGRECRACGLPANSVLVRDPPEVRKGELVFPKSITDLCDICQRRHAPAAMASAIEAEL